MALAMLIATLIVIRRIPNIYESSALVVVNLRSDAEGASELNRLSKLQQEMTSRENLTALIRKHNLYPKIEEPEMAIKAMEKALKVETKTRSYSPSTPEAVSINLRHPEPKKAQAVVNDLINMLEQGNEQIKTEATAEAGHLSGQIAEVENRLKELTPKRDLAMGRLDPVHRTRADSTGVRSALASSIEGLNDNEYALGRQIAEQRNQVTNQEKIVRSLPAAPGSAAYGALLVEKSKVEAEIRSSSDQYTDKHPKMVQLRAQLAELNRQISSLDTQTGPVSPLPLSPEGRELGVMRRDLIRMETDLGVVQRQLQRKNQQISKLPQAADSSADLIPMRAPSPADDVARTEYDRMVMRYGWLLDKQDSLMKLSGAQGPASPTKAMFHVIDAANAPRLPAAPNRLFLQLIALGVAILFGLFVTLAVELPRMFRINDNRDVEYFLGAPVLAAIPESFTPTERARNRKLRLTRGALVVALAVALAPILVMLLDYLKVFQLIAGK